MTTAKRNRRSPQACLPTSPCPVSTTALSRFCGSGTTAAARKTPTSHTFAQSFATHPLADGYDIGTVQELLGHQDVHTTKIYTYVANRGGRGVRSPADGLAFPPDER